MEAIKGFVGLAEPADAAGDDPLADACTLTTRQRFSASRFRRSAARPPARHAARAARFMPHTRRR